MKNYILLLLLISLASCQTLKIKDKNYKISNNTTELASIGLSKSIYIKNDFSTRVFPNLENKIRVDVSIVPFDKKSNKFYIKKSKYNQSQSKIEYIDSLDTKPELVTISILDISGYLEEINSDNNKKVINFLKDTKKAKLITSIATTLSSENINKIKQADAYYLINKQEKKYALALYKSNKMTETIDLQSGVVLGYELSKSCWALNKRQEWYLADIINDCKSCKGNTHTKIKEKRRNKSLYKM